MHDQTFLHALAMVLCVAAVTTVIFQRLKQPVVLGYLLAGLLVGPHLPFPMVADAKVVRSLSEVGVILLMFSLGLEFSLRKLAKVGPAAALTALVETSLMMWLGFSVVRLFGWSTMEGLFAGALLAISSTTIVAKAFQEQMVSPRLREIVVGVLIVEDLIAILLLASLTAIGSGSGLATGPLLITVGKLVLFLAALIVFGLLIVPRVIRLILRLNRPETTIVAAIGLCFALALLAEACGYSVALGAFIAGSLIAESGRVRRVEPLVEPVRDIFAAVFFVSVGMSIEPHLIARHAPVILALSLLVIVGKVIGVTLGAFLTGNRLRTSVQAGMSLAQIGEFSFIIAGLGLTLGAVSEFLFPVAIAISALTTLTTPWMIRASGWVGARLDHHLPTPIQTFVVLYGSWIEGLRGATRSSKGVVLQIRRRLILLLVDAILGGGVLFGVPLVGSHLLTILTRAGVPENLAWPALIAATVGLSTFFCLGMIRAGRQLGRMLAELVLPASGEGRLDFAEAPRRLLIVSLELVIVIMVGAPLLVVTRPFLSPLVLSGVLATLLLLLGLAFWRGAANLQGHVRAGAEVIIDALATQSRGSTGDSDTDLRQVEALLPGLGTLSTVRLETGSQAIGKSLAAIDLRAQSGASVLAIARGSGGVVAPTAAEVLQRGDVLALTGTREAIAAARELLAPGA